MLRNTSQRSVDQRTRIRAVLNECLQRQALGDSIDEASIIASNPELMPALARELRLLRVMERAAKQARGSSDRSSRNGGCTAHPEPTLERIPGYRIVREIHRGGQGVVLEAVQESTQRTVALKVLHGGPFASPADQARMEREVALLARLQHPNIVTVHDKGVVAGVTYFVMDYINGVPLDRWAKSVGDRTRQAIRQIVAVMLRACEAVHAAHLRGVIHRDLKPGNILVTSSPSRSDQPPGTVEPRVLDFGLAKDISGEAAGSATGDGQFVGSLPWASPEQVCGGVVDLRTDVYSLGVTLYQALTGVLPYSTSGTMADAMSRISTAAPVRPSTLVGAIDGDLETIVLRCLSKEPGRRYQSAGELARDLDNFLGGRPIEARRDSTLYVLLKNARRYRWTLATTALFVVFLATFAAYAWNQAKHHRQMAERERVAKETAESARRSAEAAETEADRQRRQAREAEMAEARQRQTAERQAHRAQSVTSFLVEMLGLANSDITHAPEGTIRQFLDRASAEIGQSFADDPESEARLRTEIGEAYASLGEPEAANTHLTRALDLRRRVLTSRPEDEYEVLWPLLHVQGDLSSPLASGRRAECRDVGQAVLADKSPALGAALAEMFRQLGVPFRPRRAIPALLRVDECAKSLAPGDPSRLVLGDQFYLCGVILATRGAPMPASDYLRRAIEIYRETLPETHTRIVRALGQMVSCELDARRYKEAETIARDSLEILRRTLPNDHWYVALHEARVGGCLIGQGRLDEAEAILLRRYAEVVAARGLSTRHAAEILRYLIKLYEARGQAEEAKTRRAELARSIAGSPEACTWSSAASYATSLRMAFGPELRPLRNVLTQMLRGRFSTQPTPVTEAERVIKLSRKLVPDDHPVAAGLAELYANFSQTYLRRGKAREMSMALAQEALRLARASPWLHPRKKAGVIQWMATMSREAKDYVACEAYLHEAIEVLGKRHGAYGFESELRTELGQCLVEQQRFAEAEQALRAGYEGLYRFSGSSSASTQRAMNLLVELYEHWECMDRLEPFALLHLDRALAERRSATAINSACWRIVRYPGMSSEALQRALNAIHVAVAMAPDAGNIRNTLGVAEYRVGRYADALRTLALSDALNTSSERGRQPYDLAFMAMCHFQLGERAAADHALAELNSLMQNPRLRGEQNNRMQREAQQLIRTKP